MRSGFDANVPARKPRTQIGRVLTELTTGPEGDGPQGIEETVDGNVMEGAIGARESTLLRIPSAPGASRGSAGRERVAALRERLAVAAKAPTTGAEPRRTATAVREAVDALRARLDESVRERAELAGALDESRAALASAEAALRKERKARAAVEMQAEERARIADEAVAEAEALAGERDQVLGELAHQRRIEDEQATLLVEAEAVLARRNAERAAGSRELTQARELIRVQAADVADLSARLQGDRAERARIEARCRELEAEVARLGEAREALDTIGEMVTRRR
jgi:chromosome segregation ATPase